MSEPGTPDFEKPRIGDEELISDFIRTSTYGQTMENPGPLFEAAQAKYLAWLAQEQAAAEALRGVGGIGSISLDARRITVLARGGMKEYAAGELADLETQVEFDGNLTADERNRLRGELDRLRLALQL